MALTPGDIEGKTFGTALRGYDLDEVDDFLDEMVTTLRDLEDQLATARVTQSESTEPPVVADESAVGRALIAAQAAGDTIVSDAKEEAERILDQARGEADTWAAERDAKKAEADVEMAELTTHVSNVRTQLALLATTVADSLDDMDQAIGGQTDSTATGDVRVDEDEDEEEANDPLDDDDEVESFDLDDQETPNAEPSSDTADDEESDAEESDAEESDAEESDAEESDAEEDQDDL